MKYSVLSARICILFFAAYAYLPEDLFAMSSLFFGGVSFICGAIEKGFDDE